MSDQRIPPHLNDFNGACSEKGRFKLQLFTEGQPKARELRNICRYLELTAQWLEEDEKAATSATDGEA